MKQFVLHKFTYRSLRSMHSDVSDKRHNEEFLEKKKKQHELGIRNKEKEINWELD